MLADFFSLFLRQDGVQGTRTRILKAHGHMGLEGTYLHPLVTSRLENGDKQTHRIPLLLSLTI